MSTVTSQTHYKTGLVKNVAKFIPILDSHVCLFHLIIQFVHMNWSNWTFGKQRQLIDISIRSIQNIFPAFWRHLKPNLAKDIDYLIRSFLCLDNTSLRPLFPSRLPPKNIFQSEERQNHAAYQHPEILFHDFGVLFEKQHARCIPCRLKDTCYAWVKNTKN